MRAAQEDSGKPKFWADHTPNDGRLKKDNEWTSSAPRLDK
jgi:hypothetical protein